MSRLDYGAASIRDNGRSRTVTYTPVRHQEQRRGTCPACGKKRNRSRTFEQTMSPFNKDPETGQPKTYAQVLASVRESAEKWTPDFTCAGCAS